MIYCLGRKIVYDKYIKNDPDAGKKGRTKGYSGGSVWKTIEKAKKHITNGYDVYGVMADWEKDTVLSEKGDWNDLLVDAKLVLLNMENI